jgi:hypothetical protein
MGRLSRKAFVLALALGGVGCNGGTKVLAPADPPPVSIDLLRAAPDTLTLNGYPTVLGLNLTRDFMPMSPPDGRPMTAMATFYPISEPDFAMNVTAVYAWVVKGNEVWGTGMTSEDPSHLPHNEVVWLAEGGPKWDPGIQVDVIIGLMIENRGLQLVRQTGITIDRAE